jgi:fatty acid/phospholipid biosynthesis enzyme
MKNIIVALSKSPLNLKDLISAFKVFAKHNADIHLIVVGNAKQLNILQGNKDIETLIEEENAPKAAFKKTSSSPETATIVLGSREELLTETSVELKPQEGHRPILAALIPTRVRNRSVFFADLGANPQGDESYLKECLEKATEFEEKVFLSKKNRYTLLYPDALLAGSVSAAFDQSVHLDSSYLGIIKPSEILEGKSEIVVGESSIIVSALEGAKGSVAAIYETGNEEIKKSVFFRFGLWCLRDVRKTLKERFDRKFYGNGLILFGYPYPILGLESSTTFGGMSKALETTKRWLYMK